MWYRIYLFKVHTFLCKIIQFQIQVSLLLLNFSTLYYPRSLERHYFYTHIRIFILIHLPTTQNLINSNILKFMKCSWNLESCLETKQISITISNKKIIIPEVCWNSLLLLLRKRSKRELFFFCDLLRDIYPNAVCVRLDLYFNILTLCKFCWKFTIKSIFGTFLHAFKTLLNSYITIFNAENRTAQIHN